MKKRNTKGLIKEYIRQIYVMTQLMDEGIFSLDGIEQHRMNLHDAICEAFNIDRIKNKDLLNHLEEKLNFSFYDFNDEILDDYTKKLYNYLLEHKDEYK